MESLVHSEPTGVAEIFRNPNVIYQNLLPIIVIMIVKYSHYTSLHRVDTFTDAVSNRDFLCTISVVTSLSRDGWKEIDIVSCLCHSSYGCSLIISIFWRFMTAVSN
jgi:hypothetical protein